MFSTKFKKICCNFAEKKVFEKSKMAAMMAYMLRNHCCNNNSNLN